MSKKKKKKKKNKNYVLVKRCKILSDIEMSRLCSQIKLNSNRITINNIK